MTYETGLDGVLLPAVCIQLYLKAEPIADSSVVGALHQTWDGLRRVAKAQHQADIEVVKGIENRYKGLDYVVYPEGVPQLCAENCFEACREVILKALGEKGIE